MTKGANQTQGDQQQAVTANDAASFVSNTSTLVDSMKSTTSDSSKKSENKKKTTLGDSATSFAKKAAEEGWSAPTATRPSLG